jgi:hypothetical protein
MITTCNALACMTATGVAAAAAAAVLAPNAPPSAAVTAAAAAAAGGGVDIAAVVPFVARCHLLRHHCWCPAQCCYGRPFWTSDLLAQPSTPPSKPACCGLCSPGLLLPAAWVSAANTLFPPAVLLPCTA